MKALRFKLQSLLIFIAVLALPLAYVGVRTAQVRRMLAAEQTAAARALRQAKVAAALSRAAAAKTTSPQITPAVVPGADGR
jgi:hypothetical protein